MLGSEMTCVRVHGSLCVGDRVDMAMADDIVQRLCLSAVFSCPEKESDR